MSGDNLNKYYIYRNLMGKLLSLVGLYPLKKPSMFRRLMLYINIILHLNIGFGIICYIRANVKHIVIVASVISPLVSHSISIIKICCMLIHQDNLLHLFKDSDKTFHSLINNPRSTDLLKNFSTFWYLLCVVVSMSFGVLLAGLSIPVILFILDLIHLHKRKRYPLLIEVIYPWFSREKGIDYTIQFLMQSYIAVIPIILNCSFEPSFTLFVFRMIVELRDISYHISHIDESNDQDSLIRYCISQYATLLKYRDIVQKVFGPIILQMFISNAIVLCANVFVLTQISINKAFIGLFVSFVLAKCGQSCICAFVGALLIVESEEYKNAVYSINWQGNKRVMSFVLLTLHQRPMELKACHFAIISINVIVSIVNTTMSYYFLLETLQGD